MNYNYLPKPVDIYCPTNLTHIDAIFNEPHIKTPYYFKIITDTDTANWWDNQETNYIPYNFFCITTRLRSYVNEDYEINYASYQYKDKMIWLVQFHTINNIVSLTKKEAAKYQKLINEFVKSDHCELGRNNIVLDKQYDPIISNNKLLINLHPDRYYNDENIKGHEIEGYYKDYLNVYLQLQKMK